MARATDLVPATTYPAIVGKIFADARKGRKLNQHSLAESLGVQQSALSKLERGEVAFTIEQLALAARVLGVTPGHLLTQADRVADHARDQGIQVEPGCADTGVSQGWVLIAGAALGALVGAAVGAALADSGKR